jgi:hypothetical protein
MRRRATGAFQRTLAGLAAAALLVEPAVAAAQPPQVGINAAVHNYVQIRRGQAQPRAAVVRERVILDDEVRTGRASQLQILLMDRSIFTVGANARVAVDRFVYDPARNSRNVGVNVSQGAFRFMSGRALRKPAGPVTVRTPVASVGIRGTIFEGVVGSDAVRIALAERAVGNVAVDPATATLLLLRGPGAGTQGDTKPGAIDITAGNRTFVLDRPNLALFIPGPGMAPIGPFEISDNGLYGFEELLRTVPLLPGAAAAAGAASWPGPASGSGGGLAPPPQGSSQDKGGGGGGGSGWKHGGFILPLVSLAAVILGILAATQGNGGNNGKDLPFSP